MYAKPTLRGRWIPGREAPRPGRAALLEALQRIDEPFAVIEHEGAPAVAFGGEVRLGGGADGAPVYAHVPAVPVDALGDPSFNADYGTRVAYATGAMANGIASVEVVSAIGRGGGIGFFGAAGLGLPRIRDAVHRLRADLGDLPWGVNLIHSPQEPAHEHAVVDLLLAEGVRTVEASAFLKLQPSLARYRAAGLSENPDGTVRITNRVVAKVSRDEVAVQFARPAPPAMLRELVAAGQITEAQARLAARVPVADDLTAEADSGGHTDNRPSLVLLSVLLSMRDRVAKETGVHVRIGAAGGIATPQAVAAAYAAGASYVMTGTVNQACVEAGTSPLARSLLADAGFADVDMAPASDMFESGVKVQVLKRGTMFSRRAEKLYEVWRAYPSLEAIPADERKKIEDQILRRPAADVWAECERFFAERDPAQLERAAREPKHRMALVFRWYLGLSSRWAIAGDDARKLDLQVWCGPAIGAFNAWTQGTFLADPGERKIVVVAANLLAGAAAITRARMLTVQGVDPGPEAFAWAPRPIG